MFLLVIAKASAQEVVPYEWSAVLTLEGISSLAGGVERGGAGLANLDITVTVDTEAAGWWNNGTWFVYGLGDYGRDPSMLIGTSQGVSNIAADDAVKLYEFWYRQALFSDHVSVLVGLHDFNSAFYSLDAAGIFTLPPFGIGSETAQVTPSIFPTTSAAVLVAVEYDPVYFLLAAYDGVPGDPDNSRGTHIQFSKDDGLFKSLEFGVRESSQYKLAVGVWEHTALVENAVDGKMSDHNNGYYVIGESSLGKQWNVFFQYGHADKDKNQLDAYWGAGIVVSDCWRQDDAVGLAVASARNGTPFLMAYPLHEKQETIYELTYYMPLVRHLNSQFTLYYFQNPGMNPMLRNALALGVRLYVEF